MLSAWIKIFREYGIEVWFDRDQLRPGHRWRDEIRAGIAQGDFFIACFSKRYSERARTYMNEELTLAIEELRQRPTDRAWFLPVLISEPKFLTETSGLETRFVRSNGLSFTMTGTPAFPESCPSSSQTLRKFTS